MTHPGEGKPIPNRGAFLEAGWHFLGAERFDLAAERSREGLARFPNDPDLLDLLARALRGQGQPEEAEAAARDALTQDPNHVNALLTLGSLAQQAGRHREAENLFLDGLRIAPNEPSLLVSYASLMLKVGHLEKAEALTREALKYAPDEATAQSLLAMIQSTRKLGEGREAAETGLRLEPAEQLSHRALGLQSYVSGHPFRAKRHFREALRLDPRDPGLVEAYEEADRATRWTYLPFYYYGLVVDRLPGRQFLIWGIFVALILLGPRVGVPSAVIGPIAVLYIGLVIYTWIARPLTALWIKWRPLK